MKERRFHVVDLITLKFLNHNALNNSVLKSSKVLPKNTIFNYISRTYGSGFLKEFDISQFCTVNINCPYNINVKPLDVFQSQDKVFLNFDGNTSKQPNIKCEKKDDTILINVTASNTDKNCALNVAAPVKANLKVLGGNGNINIGSFYGKFIDVKSFNGHINISKSQGEYIILDTNNGDITCKGVIQAGDITLQTKCSGKITTDRLQGLKLKASTEYGSINIASSYCDNTIFETDFGELNLYNIHKRTTININHEALLTIVGFDGELFVYMKKGVANVQIAKILKDSIIFIEDPSFLKLKLSDDCQQNSIVNVLTKNYVLSDSIIMNHEKNQDYCILFPQNENALVKLEVKCVHSAVSVDTVSWPELLKASLNKKKT